MKKYFSALMLTMFISAALFGQDINAAKKFFEEKNYEKSKAECEKVIKKNDKNHEAYFLLGKSLFSLREFDDASDAFEDAIDLKDNVADYHFWLAQSYGAEAMSSNVFSQALLAPKIKTQYIKTLELDKTHVPARVGLVNYYLRAPSIMGGSVEKAYENANKLVSIDEKQGLYLLALVYDKDEKLNKAEEQFKLLENKYGSEPEFYQFYNNYGYFLLRQKRYDEAIEKFKKQVALAPNEANPYDSLGDAYEAAGDKESAIAQYKKALEINPKFESSIKNLKKLQEEKGKK